jgi:hypothetical protein
MARPRVIQMDILLLSLLSLLLFLYSIKMFHCIVGFFDDILIWLSDAFFCLSVWLMPAKPYNGYNYDSAEYEYIRSVDQK